MAIPAAVFAGFGNFSSAQAFSDGFVPVIGVLAGLSLLGVIAGLALPGRRTVALAQASASESETQKQISDEVLKSSL